MRQPAFPPTVPTTEQPSQAAEHPAAPPVRRRRQAPPRRWPKPLRKDPMEAVAMVLIGAGVFMLCQPFSIGLFGWSFLVILTGTVMFLVVSHFPE
jgi:hypothetical protein